MAVKIADNKEHSNLTIDNCGVQRTIYKLSIDSVISYIGETSNFERRKREHTSQLQSCTHKNIKLSKRYAFSQDGIIEIEPVIELPTSNLFIGYVVEGLVNSYYSETVVNDIVIMQGKLKLKLPKIEKPLAKRLLEVIADWYQVPLNL